jgi:hypothetical protein
LRKALEKWVKASNRTTEQLLSASGFFFETDLLIRHHANAPQVLETSWVATAELSDALGANATTPQHIIRALAEWGEASVATNSAADANTLRLTYLRCPHAAADLAANPASPPDLLLELVRARNQEEVLPALVANPNSPEELLLLLATHKRWSDLFDFDDTDRKLLNHPNVSGRVLDALIAKSRIDLDAYGVRLARDLRLSAESFQRLAKIRGGAAVRKQLAANAAVPMELLQQLSTDKDESVKKAATRALKQRHDGVAQ